MNKKEDSERLFQKLRELRKSRGLTVDTLAAKMGENSQKVARIERGARALTVDYLVKVSKALQTPVSSLIESEKKETSPSPDLLNTVVLWVEENYPRLIKHPDPKKKAQLISKIFTLTSLLSVDQQSTFLNYFLEGLLFVSELDLTEQ